MVFENCGFPDPGNDNEQLSPNNEAIHNVQLSDSDDEGSNYQGYQPLPMNDTMESSNSEEEENAVGITTETPIDTGLPPICPIEQDLVREVWSQPPPKTLDIEMDSTKVDEVKEAMKNIILPDSAIPEWANNIPEHEWKQTLFDKLQKMRDKQSP